ncbi:MAG: hypothetical protein IJY42_03480, partial [Clostridia bacterium]|nr:hypothetical protein [Clostridia bacterium]
MEHCKQAPIEIERKFLIRFPDVALLKAQTDCRELKFTQTYLTAEPGCTHRVRAVEEAGTLRFYQTRKR